MKRDEVQSSNIKSIGWDRGSLEIEFHSGGVYQYADVSKALYLDLMGAESHGKFFHEHIKGVFDYERIR